MKFIRNTFILFVLLFVGFPSVIHAETLSPSSGTYNPGISVSIAVYAAPNGSGQNAVDVRLGVTNMTITNFVPVSGSGWVGSTPDPDCAGNNFTSTKTCVSMAKSTTITSGELLGTLTVTMGSAGTATITKISGNAYSNGTTQVPDLGTAATFTLSGNPVNNLPNTAIGDDLRNITFLVMGIVIIILGISLFNSNRKYYEKTL